MAPLFVIDVPPILDYPNHLARCVVLAFRSTDPVLSKMYTVHWSIIPNLAVDLLLPPLLHVLPVHVAGRIMLGLSLLLPFAGVLAYSRAVFRRRLLWPFASSLVAFNLLFLLGFMNFLIAVGLAFLLGAVWRQWGDRFPFRTGVGCAFGALAIFFCHLAGVLLFAMLVSAREAERLIAQWKDHQPMLRPISNSTALLSLMMVPTSLLYCASSFSSVSSVNVWPGWAGKGAGLLSPVLNYNLTVDVVTAVSIVGFVVLCLCAGWWEAPLSSVIALSVLLLLYLAAPFIAMGGSWVNTRFVVMAGFVLFAGFTPVRLPRRIAFLVCTVATSLLLLRTAVVSSAWTEHKAELHQLRAAIAPVAPGARVLVVTVSPETNPTFWAGAPRSRRITAGVTMEMHEAALLLIERRAFWPLLFTIPSQQPVSVRAPFREISVESSMPPDFHALLADPPTAPDLQLAPYLAGWQKRFDNVLVLDAEGVPDIGHFLPAKLEFLNNTGFAALFRVRHPFSGE